tara:strand:+ start:207 stop:803 length:597 start_codon:yes stop_codon:yes gene_type:complete
MVKRVYSNKKKMVSTNSQKNERGALRKKGISKKVGGLSLFGKKDSKRPETFAARLAAFVLENHKGNVEFEEEGGFKEGQPYIFGILPFLHLNISYKDFRRLSRVGEKSKINRLNSLCTKSEAVKSIQDKVDFRCLPQSKKGVFGITDATLANINSKDKWNSRTHGRKILAEIKKNMEFQVKKGLISDKSLAWSIGFTN